MEISYLFVKKSLAVLLIAICLPIPKSYVCDIYFFSIITNICYDFHAQQIQFQII